MRQDIKDAWIEALRSNEYDQGAGQLMTPIESPDWEEAPEGETQYGYCCLGVLADVLNNKFPEVLAEFGVDLFADEYSMTLTGADGEPNGNYLPRTLADGLGLHLDQQDVAKKNDGGATFRELADLIEQGA